MRWEFSLKTDMFQVGKLRGFRFTLPQPCCDLRLLQSPRFVALTLLCAHLGTSQRVALALSYLKFSWCSLLLEQVLARPFLQDQQANPPPH